MIYNFYRLEAFEQHINQHNIALTITLLYNNEYLNYMVLFVRVVTLF